jgi:hypothetical protein
MQTSSLCSSIHNTRSTASLIRSLEVHLSTTSPSICRPCRLVTQWLRNLSQRWISACRSKRTMGPHFPTTRMVRCTSRPVRCLRLLWMRASSSGHNLLDISIGAQPLLVYSISPMLFTPTLSVSIVIFIPLPCCPRSRFDDHCTPASCGPCMLVSVCCLAPPLPIDAAHLQLYSCACPAP